MSLAERLLAALPAPASAVAAAARERYASAGLPGARVESWRYSSLRGMEDLDPGAGLVAAGPAADLPGVDGTLLEFGCGLVQAGALPAGVALDPQTPDCDESIDATARESDSARAFQLLNAAGATLGATLDVRAVVSGVWRIGVQHDVRGFQQSRLRIQVRAGAAITLIEHLGGSDLANGLLNHALVIDLEPGAALKLIRVQEFGAKAYAVARTTVRLGAGASLELICLELGGMWSRHDLEIHLDAADASAKVSGLVALQGRQHQDTQLALTHAVGGASSRTLWKAIANGRSRAVFDGLISVAPGADGTQAHLNTANLLLSAHAEIDARPQLVIEADEVVCSHGATVGQLDDRALFYLRSRGIPEAQARGILTLAFGGAVLSAIADTRLREALGERVAAHLPQDVVA